jgi:hypothetical protein
LKQFEFLSSHTSPILTDFADLLFTAGLMDEMKLGELPDLDSLQNAETYHRNKDSPHSYSQKLSPPCICGQLCCQQKPLNFVNQSVMSTTTKASETSGSFVQLLTLHPKGSI